MTRSPCATAKIFLVCLTMCLPERRSAPTISEVARRNSANSGAVRTTILSPAKQALDQVADVVHRVSRARHGPLASVTPPAASADVFKVVTASSGS